MEDKTVSLIILAILVVWERTCSYLLNKKGKIMDMNIVSKSAILWLEHFALITGGFIAGAFAFYFRSKHYLKTRLFTKDEVKEIVDMAIGEELRNVKRSK